MSKPVAGQWYEWGKCRRFCIANDPKGGIVLQDSDGEFSVWEQWICDVLKHLPDCTGWDWQPETFPQWIDHQQKGKNRGDVAYLKRTSKESYVCVRDDGGEESYQWSYECDEMLKSGYWIQITEQQALALLDKPHRVRCRRKDLPKRTVTVPKWLVVYSTGEAAVIEQSARPLVGVEFHRVGETTYTEQEDGTWIAS